MLGVKIKGQMCGSRCVPLFICDDSPIGLVFLVLELGP